MQVFLMRILVCTWKMWIFLSGLSKKDGRSFMFRIARFTISSTGLIKMRKSAGFILKRIDCCL